jgi:serine/threonine-protein kinase
MSIPERLAAALADRYSLERELGEGGMAVVYLARDLKHNRQVAIKVLKDDLAAVVGEDRFLSEIETTAQLQHPNILPLFDSGAEDGFLFYAMPYVEGETLREKLKREVQLPVEDAVDLVRKVASALDYAHEKGIVHRDIKPANILLSSGEPLIADFGIALAVSQANDGRRTETGLSLGTPHYMSPEQAAGDRSLDPRSDIYALGSVLQELLTGEPPFSGANAQAVLARILTTRPAPVTSLRPTVPQHVDSVIAKALEKLPADRFKTAKDFRKALVDPDFRHTVVERTMGSSAVPTQTRIVREGVKTPLAAAIGGGALVVGLIAGAAVLGGGAGDSSPLGERAVRASLELPDFPDVDPSDLVVTLSPDGENVVVGSSRAGSADAPIHVRAIDDTDFRPIPGTEGGETPTFSPDGSSIAFVHRESNRLLVVNLDGGGLRTIVNEDAIRPFLPHWGTEDRIVFTGPQGVHVASAITGASEDLVALSAAGDEVDPFLLPGGQAVLIRDGQGGDGIRYVPLDRDTSWVVTETGGFPSYLPSGELLYTTPDGGLFAVPFDPDRGETSGSPVRLLDGIHTDRGTPGYQVTASGDLIQVLGPAGGPAAGGRSTPDTRMHVLEEDGTLEALPPLPMYRGGASVSPDQRYIAFAAGEDFNALQIYTYDLQTGDDRQLTYQGDHGEPAWSPDGEWIVFSTFTGSVSSLSIIRADGVGEPETLLARDSLRLLTPRWFGDELVLTCWNPSGRPDVCRGRMQSEGEGWTLEFSEEPYLSAEWDEAEAMPSPDGQLIALESEMGSEVGELYVATWPDPTTQDRGTRRESCCLNDPKWASDGSAVYFYTTSAADTVWRATVERDPLNVLQPEMVFTGLDLVDLDVFDDGRLLLNAYVDDSQPNGTAGPTASEIPIRHFLVVNWRAELERKLAEARR